MKRILVRSLPILMAVSGLLLAELQWRMPLSYPWPLVGIVGVFIVSSGMLIFGRSVSASDAWHQLFPTLLLLVTAGLGMLLAEQAYERLLLTFAVSAIPMLALELYYLAHYEPTKYPVNGMSRLNIALVPIIAFFAAVSLYGMQVFLRLPPWYALVSFPLASAFLYFVTSHPTAERMHSLRWAGVGAIAGLHAAVLVLMLPVPLPVHGAIAAVLLAAPLRIRRYAHPPIPSRRLAWFEGVTAGVLFFFILLTSRWA